MNDLLQADVKDNGEKMRTIKRLKLIPCKTWLIIILVSAVLLIVLVASLAAKMVAKQVSPVVLTHCGKVRGRQNVSTDGREVSEFLYIPYSVSPAGERRWKHSYLMKEEECWTGLYPADQDREIKCVQASYLPPQGQEDCLYLSVRTPNISPDIPLPVIVWVHGGSLAYGYGEDPGYSADADFTAAMDCVTVNINYRLDSLGFTSHPALWEDRESYGNFGINDALTALQWVKTNIAAFGGNPDNVMIMGESSGGTIVVALVTSPKAQGLFKKAFAMSPVPLWKSTYRDAHDRRPNFLKHVKCDMFTSNTAVASCLRSADLELLINDSTIANRGWGFYDFPMSMGDSGESMDYNVKEPFLLPYFPQDIPDQSRTGKIDLILSNTAQENAFWWIFYGYNRLHTWDDAEELLKSRLETFFGKNDTSLLSRIKTWYGFGNENNGWGPQKFWDTLTTDIRATCPMNDLTDRLNESPHVSVYRLYIAHEPSSEMDGGAGWGAWHGWDTEAMFGFKYYRGQSGGYEIVTQHDWELSKQLRTLTKQLVKGDMEDWSETETFYLNNHTPWREANTAKPQLNFCKFWTDVGLDGWGWQN